MSNQPIGIFDSGFGGLTVLRAVRELLPDESVIYLADNLYAPYGERSQQVIIDRSRSICRYFVEHKVKAVVVACNTATAAAIDVLREEFEVPIIGAEPGIKMAAERSANQRIGLLATKHTLESERYKKLLQQYGHQSEICAVAGSGLVEAIEQRVSDQKMAQIIEPLLAPMQQKQVDTLILGCTHYPLISGLIQQKMGDQVKVLETGEPIARQLKNRLQELDLLNQKKGEANYRFIASGKKAKLHQMVQDYLGLNADEVVS